MSEHRSKSARSVPNELLKRGHWVPYCFGPTGTIAARPFSTSRVASSSSGASRWKTKSSSMGRFTPHTTTRRSESRHHESAAIPQLPACRSTKTTARSSPAISSSSLRSCPGLFPSFDSALSPLADSPAIRRAADTNPSAMAPCATTTPIAPDESLKILLQIAAELLVERPGRVYP